MKTKQENNKNANKKELSAAILKKVHRTMVVIKKIKGYVYFLTKNSYAIIYTMKWYYKSLQKWGDTFSTD